MIKTQQYYQAHPQSKQQPSNSQQKQWEISDFEIGPQLGKGKFSEVFICREKKSGFIVALKIMDKQFLKQYGLEKQIKREILLQKCMQQENILQLYGFFHDENKIYLILEYSEQGDLYTLMHQYKDKKLPEELSKFFIKQVINALIYLHSHNIIHRDLKPENLLISNGGIKLADFGLATKHMSPPNEQMNYNNNNFQDSIQYPEKRKTFCGTLDYISPEMFLKQGHDNKIDIWSVGVLMFELCAGRPPFESQTYDETKEKVINCQQINYPQHFSQELKHLLAQILVAQPEKRLNFQQIIEHQWFKQQHIPKGQQPTGITLTKN